MNARVALIGALAVATFPFLPAGPQWHPPHVPAVKTHEIDDAHVARCQRLAARWNPSDSDPSLDAWAHCMNLRRQP